MLAALPEHTPESVRDALRHGELAAALQAAVEADDLAAATDVLRIGWFDLLRDDNRHSSRDVLDGLSAAALTSHPLLAMALGMMFNADGLRRSKAAYYFGLASVGIRSWTATTPAPERALVLASESAAFRLLGKRVLSVRSARAGVEALEEIREDRAALVGYLPRVYAQLGTSLYYGGEEAEALEVYARGYAEAGERDLSSFTNLSMMAGIRALSGDMPEASEYVSIARGAPWTDEQRAKYPGTFYRLAETMLALERFDVERARHHLDAMDHDRRSIEHWVAIAGVEAVVSLLEGDAAGALFRLESFATLRGEEGRSPTNRARLASVRSVLHLALGNYDAAANVLRRDGGDDPQHYVDRARVALALGETSEALRQLRRIAGAGQSARTLAQALTLEAAVALRTASARRTAAVVRQLAAVLRQSGQRIAVHLVPPEDFERIVGALEEMGESDLIDTRSRGALIASPELPRLTSRERAVLEALTRTGSQSEIAAQLFVSTNTVKSQLRSLYRKLGATSREQALTIALQRDLISSTSPQVSQ